MMTVKQLQHIIKLCSFYAENFREKINANKDKIPEHVLKVIEEELTKLQRLEAPSSDNDATYNYLDWLTVLPWQNFRFAI